MVDSGVRAVIRCGHGSTGSCRCAGRAAGGAGVGLASVSGGRRGEGGRRAAAPPPPDGPAAGRSGVHRPPGVPPGPPPSSSQTRPEAQTQEIRCVSTELSVSPELMILLVAKPRRTDIEGTLPGPMAGVAWVWNPETGGGFEQPTGRLLGTRSRSRFRPSRRGLWWWNRGTGK